MAVETQLAETRRAPKQGKFGKKEKGKVKKNKMKMLKGSVKKVKVDPKMKKLFRKRAREYHSDDDEEDDQNKGDVVHEKSEPVDEHVSSEEIEDEHGDHIRPEDDVSDEDGDIQPGISKFTEGCKALKMAFRSIMKTAVSDVALGPVLSAHKKLVIEKLAEEEAEKKSKGEAKKEKHLVAERGHVKPLTYLDSHEKFLIGVATKGVVKLFNAVNKAQSAQKGLNPLRSSDAKVIRKRRKEVFFSELGKTAKPASNASAKDNSSEDQKDEGPSWAPLRDNYMLTSSKLKDWDKKPDTIIEGDIGRMSEDSSSDND